MQLPVQFQSSANSTAGVATTWKIQSGAHAAQCAVPVEFGGPGGGFSPEDLFVQALINCFVGTFKVYAEASKLTYKALTVSADLTVDKNDSGQVVMKQCQLTISIQGAEKPDRLETLVAKAMRSGFILNSVKTELSHTVQFN